MAINNKMKLSLLLLLLLMSLIIVFCLLNSSIKMLPNSIVHVHKYSLALLMTYEQYSNILMLFSSSIVRAVKVVCKIKYFRIFQRIGL
jgi:hypothetical protein